MSDPVTLTHEDIVQMFFQCKNNDPQGVYVGDPKNGMLDIVEFARVVEATLHARLAEGRQWPYNFKGLRRL